MNRVTDLNGAWEVCEAMVLLWFFTSHVSSAARLRGGALHQEILSEREDCESIAAQSELKKDFPGRDEAEDLMDNLLCELREESYGPNKIKQGLLSSQERR